MKEIWLKDGSIPMQEMFKEKRAPDREKEFDIYRTVDIDKLMKHFDVNDLMGK